MVIGTGNERAHRAGVVKMNGGEGEMVVPTVSLSARSAARKPRFQAARRPAVHQRRLVARQQVRRNDPGLPEVEEIDELEAAS